MREKSIMAATEAREATAPEPERLEPMPLLPLFAYGTLEDSTFVGHLLEHPARAEPARLPGFALADLPGVGSAVLFPSEEHEASGVLYRDLTPDDYARLDAYTGAMEGLYLREIVEVTAGKDPSAPTETAFAYLPTDQTLRRYS